MGNNIIKNGYSLIEVLVVIVIMGIIGIGTATLIQNSMRGQKAVEIQGNVNSLINSMREFLSNQSACNATFVNMNYSTPPNPIIPSLKKAGTAGNAFQTGTIYEQNTLELNKMQIDSSSFKTIDIIQKKALIDLDIYVKRTVQAAGSEMNLKKITLQITYNASNQIINCNALSSSSIDTLWSKSANGVDIYYNIGKVGIGTTTPTNRLSVVGDGLITGDFTVGDITNPSPNSFTFYGKSSFNGTSTFNGASNFNLSVTIGSPSVQQNLIINGSANANAYYHNSDLTLKENIQTSPGLEAIRKLRGVSYILKSTNKCDFGVIAQEIEVVFPELVSKNPSTGLKSVNYDGLIAPIIESIKDLDIENKKLEERNKELELRIQRIEEILKEK